MGEYQLPGFASSQAKIIGAPLEKGYPSVCKVYIYYKGLDGSKKTASCTGVLVAPRLVMLAAHCIAHCDKHLRTQCVSSATLRVECTFYVTHRSKTTERKVRAVRWYFNPQFSTSLITEGSASERSRGTALDYGLLELANEVPFLEPVPIMPFATFKSLVRDSTIKSIKAVGFGRFSYDEGKNKRQAGKKRSFSFTKFNISPNAKLIRIYPPEERSTLLPDEKVATAHGDSGGPFFVTVDGVTYLVALISSATFGASRANGIKQTLYTSALSTDYPYMYFYKHFFENYFQSSAPLAYNFIDYQAQRRFTTPESEGLSPDEGRIVSSAIGGARLEDLANLKVHPDMVVTASSQVATAESKAIGTVLMSSALIFCVFTVGKSLSFDEH